MWTALLFVASTNMGMYEEAYMSINGRGTMVPWNSTARVKSGDNLIVCHKGDVAQCGNNLEAHVQPSGRCFLVTGNCECWKWRCESVDGYGVSIPTQNDPSCCSTRVYQSEEKRFQYTLAQFTGKQMSHGAYLAMHARYRTFALRDAVPRYRYTAIHAMSSCIDLPSVHVNDGCTVSPNYALNVDVVPGKSESDHRVFFILIPASTLLLAAVLGITLERAST